MKKTFIYLSMLAMTFGFVACSNDDDVTEQTVQQQDNMMVITASLDDNITRTSLGNGGDVVWSEGDYIIIPSKTIGNQPTIFNLISGAGKTTATFRGEKLSDGDVTYDAYYGVDAEMYLPSAQIYDAEKRISKAPMHASVTVSGNQVNASAVTFKNLCGLLKISLPETANVSIANIKMTASQPLSGNFTLTTDKEINKKLTNSSNTIVLNCGSGVDLSDGSKDFYIYVPANDYGGIKFVFTTTDGLTCTKTLKATSTINVVSSKITPITFSTVSFSNVPSVDDSYAVDLGLSVKWASKNIGAENNYDSGDYFAWGEVAPKTNFTKQNYVWYNSSTDLYTNYCNEDNYGNIAKQNTLDSSDDAAVVNWGGKWRMPTLKEWKELSDGCFWVRTNNYNGKGIGGYIIYKVDDANKADRGIMLAQSNNNSKDQISKGNSGVEYHSGEWQERVGGVIIPKFEDRDPSTHIFIPFAGHMEGAQKKNNSGSTLYMEHWIPTLSTTEKANSYRGQNQTLSENAMEIHPYYLLYYSNISRQCLILPQAGWERSLPQQTPLRF